MGTGKTSVGKRVARSLGFRFVDMDELIEQAAGKSISQIFADSGEDVFRDLETQVLKQCASGSGQVISTGGGVVLRKVNRELLQKAGQVIWLRASPDIVIERVSRNNDRPLLDNDDPAATVKKLLDDRYKFYEEAADLPITTDDLTLEETAYGVSESARVLLAAT